MTWPRRATRVRVYPCRCGSDPLQAVTRHDGTEEADYCCGTVWPSCTKSLGTRDLVEIAILAVAIFVLLRFLGKTRGAGIVRGLGLVVVGLFLVAQVVIASFDLTVLGRVLDYLLTTVLLGLLVIFQPELRRGLMVLGRYRILRYFVHEPQHPVADKLADAAEAMSRECVGALIVIEREMALAPYIETGEQIDARGVAAAAAGRSSASAARCTTAR